MFRRLATLVLIASMAIAMTGCDGLPWATMIIREQVACGTFEGPDCNDLLEIGLDAMARARDEQPVAIAVDSACPPNARCLPSTLGGDTAAVVVRWPDGAAEWATIPLPPDWPASPPGDATVMTDAPPAHLLSLIGAR